MKRLAILILVLTAVPFTGCSPSGVASRQQAINSAQAGVLNNRSTRIQARDERMNASREVWMQ
ncbi:MAG: hypothetical protein D4R65_12295 [Verrucomicrobiaceae bacterium]|nr:MAG: hypothetical protein D4R65_12295 [Verrucomicrobiaceae bacterium]